MMGWGTLTMLQRLTQIFKIMTAPKFPGFKNNTADFQGKRDQRASPLSYFDVDLSIARSPSLGNLLNLNVGGNLFYVDQNPDIGGYATVYFGDGTVRGGTPVYVGSGFLSNADFVQLSFQNVAQPGKVLRVIYGTDVNFKPQFGSIAQVNVANVLPLNVNLIPNTLDNFDASLKNEFTARNLASITLTNHAFSGLRVLNGQIAVKRIRYTGFGMSGNLSVGGGICAPVVSGSSGNPGVSKNSNVGDDNSCIGSNWVQPSASNPGLSFLKINVFAGLLNNEQRTIEFSSPILVSAGEYFLFGANSSAQTGAIYTDVDFVRTVQV